VKANFRDPDLRAEVLWPHALDESTYEDQPLLYYPSLCATDGLSTLDTSPLPVERSDFIVQHAGRAGIGPMLDDLSRQ